MADTTSSTSTTPWWAYAIGAVVVAGAGVAGAMLGSRSAHAAPREANPTSDDRTRALSAKQALELHVHHGATRPYGVTVRQALDAASSVTDMYYEDGQAKEAIEDLDAWLHAQRAGNPTSRPYSTNRPYWYVVVSTGIVQAVYGSALYGDACDKANFIEATTGFPAKVEKRTGKKPVVGGA
jgi:hypothetical protein